MTETYIVISCPGCGTVCAEKHSSKLAPKEVTRFFPCTKCGHTTGHVKVVLPTFRVGISAGMRAVGKNPTKIGKKKRVIEARAEPDIEKTTGRKVFVERLVDRGQDMYIEKITALKTGEVIRSCEEPLSQHQDRGSAKFKRKVGG